MKNKKTKIGIHKMPCGCLIRTTKTRTSFLDYCREHIDLISLYKGKEEKEVMKNV